MPLTTKTVEYAFETITTGSIPSLPTLALTPITQFGALPVFLPETTSRSFRNVYLEAGWRTQYTVVTNQVGWTISFGLGATTQTRQWTPTAVANTGENEAMWPVLLDLTAFFNANFGSGASATANFGLAVATLATAQVGLFTGKLVMTYDHDDAAVTQVKTVTIPIQSSDDLQSVLSLVELGSTGTTPVSSQIPALDTALPELSKVHRSGWFEILCNDGSNAGSDHTLFVQFGATGPLLERTTLEQALNGATQYRDIVPYNVASYDGSVANTVLVDVVGANTRYESLGGLLKLTYEYNADTSTAILNSYSLPVDFNAFALPGTNTGQAIVKHIRVDVQEPGPITLLNSGLMAQTFARAGATIFVSAGAQRPRPYNLPVNVRAGNGALVHRFDHSDGYTPTFGRGTNTVTYRVYTRASNTANITDAELWVNYTSAKSSSGVQAHTRTLRFCNIGYPTIAATAQALYTPATGAFMGVADPQYAILGVQYHLFNRTSALFTAAAQLRTGTANGYMFLVTPSAVVTDLELSTWQSGGGDIAGSYRAANYLPGPDPTERDELILSSTTITQTSLSSDITIHGHVFNVIGEVAGSSGATLTIGLRPAEGALNTAFRGGNGTYTIPWHSSTVTVFTETRENGTLLGRSDVGNPT